MLKTYELTARHFGWDRPPKPASQREITGYLLDRALRAQGLVSLDSICHLDAPNKPLVRRLIEARVRRNELVPVALEGAGKQEHWALPETLETAGNRACELVHILSPFDPLMIQRKRTQLFFDYEHRFEAYVPKEKRRFGYFALPVLVGDDIVAALDLKTDRQEQEIAAAEMELGRRRRGERRAEGSQAPDRGRAAPVRAVSARGVSFRRQANDCVPRIGLHAPRMRFYRKSIDSVRAMLKTPARLPPQENASGRTLMSAAIVAASTSARSELESSTIRAISWRLIPFLVLAYFFSYLDRVNLGFAALTMNAELKFSPIIFAWGAGIFFIGYFIFEVPSNLALEKFGASRWIARIMVTWGIISALMALVSGVWSFYALRFLLGVAEAGFFPGIILYLTYWYPAEYRARFLAAFAIAVPMSSVIGAPISGLLLGLDGAMGLKGWQWLFIIEGVPSVLLGIVSWFYLTDRPAKGRLADVGAEGLALRQAGKRGRRQAGRAASHAGAGIVVTPGDHAEPDLFRICRRALRHGVLAAADRQGVRLFQRADRFRHRGALSVRHRRDDPVGAAFGCDARARDACRPAAAVDRAGARRLRLHG